jgi:hypothetical protein
MVLGFVQYRLFQNWNEHFEQMVLSLRQAANIICYKKQCITRDYTKLKDCYHNIKSNIEVEV